MLIILLVKKVSSKYDSVLSFALCLLALWLVLNTIIEIIISFRIFGDEESEENND
ncbi:hypothetical protein ['Camptotheca acuminata' phytoplasma]|uniref:hypothetical protein n=1 Tax='Camptotheca acuminata' phytoplasma TaxID=3239192 RepID=UPI00351A8362